MIDTRCPQCGADQRMTWRKLHFPCVLEGMDWHCPKCSALLRVLSGRVSVVEVMDPPT